MKKSLNPLSIGSVFQQQGYKKEGLERSLSSFYRVCFSISARWMYSQLLAVLIPFLSGLFFQHGEVEYLGQWRGLNPLSIGSVFPTGTKGKKGMAMMS